MRMKIFLPALSEFAIAFLPSLAFIRGPAHYEMF
jgi:hypothetical protein